MTDTDRQEPGAPLSPQHATPRGVIGVVHLPAMPGDPGFSGRGGFSGVEEAALADARALIAGGVDALIIENFGSAPFVKGDAGQRLPAVYIAAMTWILRSIMEIDGATGLPVGVNCLRNDAPAALGIAAACGAAFIRVNVHVGAMVTDQGLIEGEAANTLRQRAALGAAGDVAILADVLVKHAAPLAPISAEAVTRDTIERGLADGVIVSGAATGAPVSATHLDEVREAAGDTPVYIGSGLTPDRTETLAPRCHGAIVGTFFKRDGQVLAPVDTDRVHRLVDAVAGRFLA